MEYLVAKTLNVPQISRKEADPGREFYVRRVSSAGAIKVKARTVTGLCSVFGNTDNGKDIVAPGA